MGRPITGATYVREQKGPHARSLQPMLAELEKDGVLTRRIADRHGEFDLLFAIKHPEISQFSPEEISIVDAVTRVVCFDSRGTIAHQASHDCVWQAANIGEVMPYFTVFAGRPGEIVAADIDWAMRLLNPRDAAKLNDHDDESLSSTMIKSLNNRCQEAIDAALWHLHRDPSIGISLPTTMASWFVYKQAGLEHLAVPDVAIVYRFDVSEFLLEAIRLGDVENDIDG
jgi:hypothetical protein